MNDEYPATQGGGHALIIEFGDEELTATCQCGHPLGLAKPNKPLDHFAGPWERHVMGLGR